MREIYPPNLNIFATPGINLAFTETVDHEVWPTTPAKLDSSLVEFISNPVFNQLLDLNSLTLYGKFQLTKENGNKYTADDDELSGSLINNSFGKYMFYLSLFHHSIFLTHFVFTFSISY